MKGRNHNRYHKLPILDGLEVLDAKHHAINFPFHTHDTFNITLVLEQPFITRLTDRHLFAQAGSIAITNPGEVHSTICDSNTGTSFFTFYVPPVVLKHTNNALPVYFENKIIDDEKLVFQFRQLIKNLDNPSFHAEQSILDFLDRLVKTYATERTFDQKEHRLFKELLEEDNFEKFSLPETARRFGLDKFKFLRLFKQFTGLTPNNYHILKRIERSKTLLQSQDDLLSIAIDTGFYDAPHFVKHFKKITGVTPIAYRQAMLCNIVP